MSASSAPALDAIALQLTAALDQYDRDVGRMVDTWLDMELYHGVSEEIEEIRLYSAALPRISVQWVELLIAHAELVHCLWRLRFQDDRQQGCKLHEARNRHAACIASLRNRCVRELNRRGTAQI